MSEFDSLFRAEADEQLEIAEQSILAYEKDPSRHYLEEAFRAMHTFKGAAHIFSLTNIGNFAHLIESIFEGLKNNTVQNNPVLLSKILVYFDHLRKMMDDPKLSNKELNEADKLFSKEIIDLTSGSQYIEEEEIKDSTNEQYGKTYYIIITPKISFAENMFHPVNDIIKDILTFGPNICSPVLLHDSSVKQWDICISCKHTPEDIECLFMFVDDEIDVRIYQLSNINLFARKGFSELLTEIEELDFEDRKDRIKDFQQSSAEQLAVLTDSTQQETVSGKTNSIRVSTEKIDVLLNLVSELVTAQASLGLFAEEIKDIRLNSLVEVMERNIRQLRDITFEVTLIPIENLVGKFKRLVRDCSVGIGKEIEFTVKGESTELDKAFIDNLSDPIMHILRNCVDHGIEMPEERIKKGKPEKGIIKLEAYYSGANVHIEITDDGNGLNTDVIQAKAIQKGLINDQQKLSKKEIFNLIFLPGFSTAKRITDISGRGVGMDVVKKNIQSLRGEIDIDSELDTGTKFTIKIPLTLSIIDGLLLRIKELNVIVPLLQVNKCFGVHPKELDHLNNVVVLDNQQIPFLDLREDFFDVYTNEHELLRVITLTLRDKKVAIIVDEIIGEYQAVLKPVGIHYKKQDYISSASILGDGTVALVLDVDKLAEQKIKKMIK